MKEQDLVCYLYVILYIYAKTGFFEAKNGSVEKYWGSFFCFIVFCIFAL